MRAIEIERLVRRAANSMADSLHFYWPSLGRNDIPERNISAHFAHVLLDHDFLLYAEAHPEDTARRHLDLLAIHPTRDTLVAAEFKRIYSTETVGAMVADLDRIRSWRLGQDRGHHQLRVHHRFGVLAATTWNPKYASWFNTTDLSHEDPTAGLLDGLWKELPSDDVVWGSIVLIDDVPVGRRERTTEWLVYVVFPLENA